MTNLHQLIYALSDALDLVGVDDIDHGKRVAYMAIECAKELGLGRDEMIRLFHASLLHDCGVSSSKIHEKIMLNLDWDGADNHCIRGFQLLNLSPRLKHLSNIILYHHTHYKVLQDMEIDRQTALLSNLIFMVDRVDALCAQHHINEPDVALLTFSHKIRQEAQELSGSFFDPLLVDTFLKVSEREVFWFSLEQENLHRYLNEYMLSLDSKDIDLGELGEIAELFAYLVDAKSHYTADHSLDVAKLAHFIATRMGLSPDVCKKIEIAGLLHDLGKLRVPDELLDKKGKLTADEFDVVKIHAFATHQILSQIEGLEEITQWASQHHEKLNGHGYPYHTKDRDISLPARIVAVADVFQALAQKRPYRPNLKPLEILQIIHEKVAKDELDHEVVAVVERDLQKCWETAITHSRKMMPNE